MALATKPPKPPDASIVLIDPKTGRATQAFVDYLFRLSQYLEALRAAIP